MISLRCHSINLSNHLRKEEIKEMMRIPLSEFKLQLQILMFWQQSFKNLTEILTILSKTKIYHYLFTLEILQIQAIFLQEHLRAHLTLATIILSGMSVSYVLLISLSQMFSLIKFIIPNSFSVITKNSRSSSETEKLKSSTNL